MTLEIGDLLDGKYRLVRLLGSGGWGTVYEGENTRTLHRVAIKVLHAEMIGRGDMIARFEREAQAAGKIGSEHIIEVYDLGELASGQRYMVMEYLDGEDLSARLRAAGRLEPKVLAPLLAQVLEGLGAAHDAGILHRDLKPENLFLVRTRSGDDFVKILDFGISKFAEAPSSMTQTGTVMGSPCYMSPEQARGSKALDNRSDIFSLGVVLFECVTGQLPFQAETFNELMFKIALEDVPDPLLANPQLDPEFAVIVRRALARDPAARFASTMEFEDALSEWMHTHGVVSHEVSLRRTPRSLEGRAATPIGTSEPRLPADPSVAHGETLAIGAVGAATPDGGLKAAMTDSPAGLSVTTEQQAPARRRMLLAIPALLVAAVGVAFFVHRGSGDSVTTTTGGAPVNSAASPDPVDPVPLPRLDPPVAIPPANGSSVPAVESASASAAPSVAVAPTQARNVARPSATARPAASASTAVNPGASAAPAGVNTIEGRRIRTGL